MRKNQVRQILYLWLVGIIFGCSSPEFLLEDQKNSNQNIKMEILNPETIKKTSKIIYKN